MRGSGTCSALLGVAVCASALASLSSKPEKSIFIVSRLQRVRFQVGHRISLMITRAQSESGLGVGGSKLRVGTIVSGDSAMQWMAALAAHCQKAALCV